MNYYIEEMSLCAERLLRSHSAGRVHSVYGKTVNLSLGGRLLALQPLGSSLSPISLITDAEEAELRTWGLAAGDPVRVDRAGIQAGGRRFSIEKAARHELFLSEAISAARIEYLEKELCKLLKTGGRGTFCQAMQEEPGEETDFFLKAVKKRLADVNVRIKTGLWEEAAEGLASLVGLGIGLTPGGDDFLCGVLAGLCLGDWRKRPFLMALNAAVRRRLDRTNDISREFLNCALKGQFGQLVHGFYERSPEEIFAEADRIGHSSGIDTLCGILYAFRLRNR